MLKNSLVLRNRFRAMNFTEWINFHTMLALKGYTRGPTGFHSAHSPAHRSLVLTSASLISLTTILPVLSSNTRALLTKFIGHDLVQYCMHSSIEYNRDDWSVYDHKYRESAFNATRKCKPTQPPIRTNKLGETNRTILRNASDELTRC